jgi:hypothetical protein
MKQRRRSRVRAHFSLGSGFQRGMLQDAAAMTVDGQGAVSIECDGAPTSRVTQVIRELTDMNRDVAAFSMSRTVAPKVRTDVA